MDDFPYWNRGMRAVGNTAGTANDGSYTYLGARHDAAGALLGYVITSDHTGSSTLGNTYKFRQGTYNGRSFQSTGRQLKLDSTAPYGPTLAFTVTPTILEFTTMQVAPGCLTSTTYSCCDGYNLGDGTCTGTGPCGGGGTCASGGAVPDLPFLPIANLSDIPQLSPALFMGMGAGVSATYQFYKECLVSDPQSGNACCRRGLGIAVTQFYQTSYSDAGTNCDSSAGFTFMGPAVDEVAEGIDDPLKWQYLRWWLSPPDVPGNQFRAFWSQQATELEVQRLPECLVGDLSYTGRPNGDPPLPRGPGMADCGFIAVTTGDSGAGMFVKYAGTWHFVGPSFNANAASIVDHLRWWYMPAIMDTKPAGSGVNQ
jgi:hypothetical protein